MGAHISLGFDGFGHTVQVRDLIDKPCAVLLLPHHLSSSSSLLSLMWFCMLSFLARVAWVLTPFFHYLCLHVMLGIVDTVHRLLGC